jgi:hypothetical protein
VDKQLACKLSGPALVERIQDWRRIASQATRRTVGDTAIVSVYPRTDELVGELRRLIDAEAECCSFMDFQLSEIGDEVIVELRVPEEMRNVMESMLGLVTEEPAPA